MPLICVVPGCKNNSSNPDCYELQWHRLPSKQEPIKRRLIVTTLGLPNDITTAKRICSSCMSRVPKGRKPPAAMENVTSVSGHRRYTRTELLQAVALDHCYSHPPEQEPPTQKRSTSTAPANIIGPLVSPEAPLLDVFCVEMYANNNDEIHFYTSFPSYEHFMICFSFLGDAVNHLIYSGSKTDPSRVARSKPQRAITPINEFFMTLCRLRCGLLELDLAFRFKVSQSTVSRILTTWINFLYHKFQEIPIWPSREQVKSQLPTQFKTLYVL